MVSTVIDPSPEYHIDSPETLRRSLIAHGIPLSTWGVGEAKTVESLWAEIVAGETSLQRDPLCRVLAGVVQVIIRQRDGRMLIEAEQIFHDNRRRQRNLPPSEKMLRGEGYLDAARRCLHDELNLRPGSYHILDDSHEQQEIVRYSWSYPGLLSKYTIHKVVVAVRGLPDRDFWTTETGRSDTMVARHRWVWDSHSDSTC